ncbi:hypothetical protein D9M71_749050 [compost metagenome]
MLTQIIEHNLADDNSRLDGLAKADLVRKQITLGVIGQNASNNIDLVRLQFNRRRKQGRNAERTTSLIKIIP